MTHEEFNGKIKAAMGDRKGLFLSQTSASFYAEYRPKFPEESAADFLIAYDCSNGTVTLSADTACVPILKRYGTFDEFLNEFNP